MSRALVLANVSVARAGVEVLHGVSLQVAPGEIVALLGANGAGKSTLVMSAAGALPLKSGTVTLDGVDISRRSMERRRRDGLAVAPEGHRTFRDLTVREHFLVAASHLPRRERDAAISSAQSLFPELRERQDARGSHLSGGQKQMVIIAQALISRPRYMLVDELSLGLAPAVALRLADALKEIAARGVGVLLIEQFTTLALGIAARACVMERGRMVFEGSAQALIDDPSVLHRAYLANV